MKTLANYISIARIFLVLTLVLIKPLSTAFFVVYILCGISDIFDGYIARKTETTSKLGEKLDPAADLIMVLILFFILYPFINITVQIFVWIVIIGIIRVASMITVFVKFKTFGVLHTLGNKITGLMLFVFTLLLTTIKLDVLMYALCIIANISAIEEFVIHLLSNELRTNRKSLFRVLDFKA
ncbi:CDP-alcohol phosphatidyltransferase family protein [Vallitalea maricola]|uniref:Uncharacterized protein n=1 Tax=Vallitalea maricola TaxID=3074433 RepID=A0ACB5UQ42_9FIRM|nr:hypothetical protein AN2V17_38960 [Vallitalea sp. AN17-2]